MSVSLDDSSQDASSQDDSQTSISGEQDSIVEVSVPNKLTPLDVYFMSSAGSNAAWNTSSTEIDHCDFRLLYVFI